MRRVHGFTLVETLFAISLLTGTLTVFAHLVASGVHTTAAARYRTLATIFAQQKMEQLRGEATLGDTAAAAEHLDASGAKVCDTMWPCPAAVFTVRWSVEPLAVRPGTVLIQVVAAHAHQNYGEARSFGLRLRSVR